MADGFFKNHPYVFAGEPCMFQPFTDIVKKERGNREIVDQVSIALISNIGQIFVIFGLVNVDQHITETLQKSGFYLCVRLCFAEFFQS